MPRDLIVIGGGEHSRVVIDAALSRPDCWNVLGIVDPQMCEATTSLLGVARLGDEDAGRRIATRVDGPMFVIGVGGVGVDTPRPAIAARFGISADRWATVVHAYACVSPSARLDAGVVVLAGAIVNAGAIVREHAILNTACVVEHDVEIGAFAQVGPRAVLGGNARLDDGGYLGLGAVVRDHIRIGRRAMVGMGAVVVDDVADEQLVMGCPAKPVDEPATYSRRTK